MSDKKLPTMKELRELGKELGIEIDQLGLGQKRTLIAAHLAQVAEQGKHSAKMSRTGDAVPVTIA